MPLFGAHMSIAGGACRALEAATLLGMETVQLFTKNNNQWAGKPFSPDEPAEFRRLLRKSKLKFATSHTSYLINLASPDPVLWRKSVEAFVNEMNRAEVLGLTYLVTHPGAHVGAGEETGLANVVRALDEIHERCPDYRLKVLLELTAGQGSCLGHRFEHLAIIINHIREKKRLGVCLDTCHVFAAGYPLSTEAEYQATFNEFDRVIGLKRLKLFHLNDSKKPFGSRVDRHEHLGKGFLGIEPFRMLVNDPHFQKSPMILETAKEDEDGIQMDPVNLAVLRGLTTTNTSPSPTR
ncbi:MAG: deoxyribonuclease IV [Gemmataceae bacterium]|nr:deoxyribonuclease IV [Gemmataceae bacterium]